MGKIINKGVENMNGRLESKFFESSYNGLKNEDELLRSLCKQNFPRYTKQHNGIYFLYETTMVYVPLVKPLKVTDPLPLVNETSLVSSPIVTIARRATSEGSLTLTIKSSPSLIVLAVTLMVGTALLTLTDAVALVL